MISSQTPTFRERLHWIFLGSDGIRAGWSIVIFILVVMIASGAVNLALHRILHTNPNTMGHELRPLVVLGAESLTTALIIGATAVMAWIERRRLGHYGLSAERVGYKFSLGWIGGFACLSLLVGLLSAGGFLVFGGMALHGTAALGYGLLWLAGFAAVAVSEEIIFRGYIQSTLTRGLGFWPAALITSLLFGLAHTFNHGETVLGLIAVIAAGLVFCLLLRATGSLWVGIGFHAAWDWAQSYFYGTPDSGLLTRGHLLISHAAGNLRMSGGDVGPEGSALGVPVMIAGLAAMVWLCRQPALRLGPAGRTGAAE